MVNNLIPSWVWDDIFFPYKNGILKFGEAYVIASHFIAWMKIPIHAGINMNKVDLIW